MLFIQFFVSIFSLVTVSINAIADIPKPYSARKLNINAEWLVSCTSFPELSASRLKGFLSKIPNLDASVKIIDGPVKSLNTNGFNVLFVLSDTSPNKKIKECILETVPFGKDVIQQMNKNIEQIGSKPDLPDHPLSGYLNPIHTSSAIRLYRLHNWVVITAATSIESASYIINDAMISLFDLPKDTCSKNSFCLPED